VGAVLWLPVLALHAHGFLARAPAHAPITSTMDGAFPNMLMCPACTR
jgi:hypothetical protein